MELMQDLLPGLRADDVGCAYIVAGEATYQSCGQPRQAASPNCPEHHALCHVPSGTAEEKKRLREVEALANAVGGRRARNIGAPSRRFLRRLEQALRPFS